MQTLTLGGLLMTALSSTTEDNLVRERLERRLPYMDVLRMMQLCFPGGIQEEIERRRKLMRDENIEGLRARERNLIEEVANEILDVYDRHIGEWVREGVAA